MHRSDREDLTHCADHALMDLDVALDPLGTHDEPWTPLARIADSVPGTHAGALRRRVDGDERRVRVRRPSDDIDRMAVQVRIGRLLARCEEPVAVEVQPGTGGPHADSKCKEGAHTVWDPQIPSSPTHMADKSTTSSGPLGPNSMRLHTSEGDETVTEIDREDAQ